MSLQLKLLVYPRGFMGVDLGHKPEKIPRKVPSSFTAIGGIGFPDPLTHSKPVFNQEIEEAFVMVVEGKQGVRTMQYREDVLRLVLKTFAGGMVGVQEFINMQSKNGQISKFIEDTFLFINTGRRTMALETWNAMLEKDNLVLISMDKAVECKKAVKYFNNSSIEMIQQWCSKPGGFSDMLYTMHILYGEPTI